MTRVTTQAAGVMTAPQNVPAGVEAPPVASAGRDPLVPLPGSQGKASSSGRKHSFRPDAGPYCRRCHLPRANWRHQ